MPRNDPRTRTRLALLAALLAPLSAAAGPPGLDHRPPWTGSKFAGVPDPPLPYKVEPAFPRLTFRQPVALCPLPGSDRLLVAELGGRVVSFPNDPAVAAADLALDLTALRPGQPQLYGIAAHPAFASNRYIYLCYLTESNKPDGTRVSRFTVSREGPPKIDPASETVLLRWLSGGHDAGCLAFGPDGYLYISTGDAADPSPPDPFDTGQDLSDLLSSVLRIDVDHAEGGKAYRVPPDNPFVGAPSARPEIWAFGFRNPWRFSFDSKSGDLWLGDVGWELWEMIDRVERGGNYGWSLVEGPQPVRPGGKRGPGPVLPPVVSHPHSEAASITGGYVYRGGRLKELDGVYVYGDFQSGKVWGLKCDGKALAWRRELADTPLQLVSFGQDSAGEIYALDFDRTQQIYKFVKNPDAEKGAGTFPRTLSASGLFASTAEFRPAPGVVPYSINAEAWADHARADRWLALPGAGRINVDADGNWSLPEGAVLAKTIGMEMRAGEPTSFRRLETQVLHREGGAWRPYTYVWNEPQTDATLAPPGGLTIPLDVVDTHAPGGRRSQDYRVHARSECLQCHNPWVEKKTATFGRQSASPLALTTGQLDRDHDYGGRSAGQVATFAHLGLFATAPSPDPQAPPRLSDPYDPRAPLSNRARSYLQVNCAHCHESGAGGSATIRLGHGLGPAALGAIDARPTQGTFGIASARIIAPGDPSSSVLYYRLAKLGSGRMPRAGSALVDEAGLNLIGDWIASLAGPPGPEHRPGEAAALAALKDGRATAEARAAAVRSLTGSTRGALALAREMHRGEVPAAAMAAALALARDLPQPETRDLFEPFVPSSERVKRLGDAIDPAAVLALEGDAGRGRALFFAESGARCAACHRVGDQGGDVGPDLTAVGAKYPKAALLQEVLEPSRTVDPQYVNYLLETKAGAVVSGLLVEKTAARVALKDAQGKVVAFDPAEVEQLAPQGRSLMPDLLLRDLTAAQAADLIEFLAGAKGPAR